MPAGVPPITELLNSWAAGDATALDRLMPLVYDELRRTAKRYMRRERAGNTLQTTALVNEVYIRLVGTTRIPWKNRVHFFAVSAQMMRRILVDAARGRNAVKRGGNLQEIEHATPVNFDEMPSVSTERSRELIAIDDALNALAEIDRRKARTVELRFFGGLSVEETGQVLGISPQTVTRDWRLAKAWLRREIQSNQPRQGHSLKSSTKYGSFMPDRDNR